MGLHLIKTSGYGRTSYAIGVDNQATLQSFGTKLNKAGHYLAREIVGTRITPHTAKKTPLNEYLHRFKKVDSANCPACGHHTETAQHFLLECPKYARERWSLTKRCKTTELKFGEVLRKSEYIGPLCNYIKATERFDQKRKEGAAHGSSIPKAEGANTQPHGLKAKGGPIKR